MVSRVTHRRDTESAFKGCFLGHAVGAIAGMKYDPHVRLPAGACWPHEVYYAQFVARSYLQEKSTGRLDMKFMDHSLRTGLSVEGGELFRGRQFDGSHWAFRLTVSDAKGKKRPRVNESEGIGGPGFAAHSMAIGLVNCHDIRRIIEDARRIGALTHRQPVAVSAGIITALAVAFALKENGDPGAIMQRLLTVLKSPVVSRLVPDYMMGKMVLVEALLAQGTDVALGIKMLRDPRRRTALDVVPGAIFHALSRPQTFEKKLAVLETMGQDNYKFWAISAALRGTIAGEEGIPAGLVNFLEEADCFRENAAALYQATRRS